MRKRLRGIQSTSLHDANNVEEITVLPFLHHDGIMSFAIKKISVAISTHYIPCQFEVFYHLLHVPIGNTFTQENTTRLDTSVTSVYM